MQYSTTTDNNPETMHERFENLPEPMQLRLFELMAAITGVLALPELAEPKETTEIQTSKSVDEEKLAEVHSLAEQREKSAQERAAFDARQNADAAYAIAEQINRKIAV